VTDIHHLHAWSLVAGKTLITLHASLFLDIRPMKCWAGSSRPLPNAFISIIPPSRSKEPCADDQDHRDHAVGRSFS